MIISLIVDARTNMSPTKREPLFNGDGIALTVVTSARLKIASAETDGSRCTRSRHLMSALYD